LEEPFREPFNEPLPKPFRNGLANGSTNSLVNGLVNRLVNSSPYQEQEQEQYKYIKETTASSDKSLSAATPAEEIFCELPCSGKPKTFQVTKAYIAEMQALYPGVDVERETLQAKAWLINNPIRQKTHTGMTRFLGNWYGKSQNETKGLRVVANPGLTVGKSDVEDDGIDREAIKKALEIRKQRGLDSDLD
jgi:hypothetical protein